MFSQCFNCVLVSIKQLLLVALFLITFSPSLSFAQSTKSESNDDPFAGMETVEDDSGSDEATSEEDKVETPAANVDPSRLSAATIRIVGTHSSRSSDGIQFSKDGQAIAIFDFTRLTVVKWPTEDGEIQVISKIGITPSGQHLVVDPKQLWSIGFHDKLTLRPLPSVTEKQTEFDPFKPRSNTTEPQLEYEVRMSNAKLASSLDGRIFVLAGKGLKLVDMDSDRQLEDLSEQVYSSPVRDVFVTDSGKQLLCLQDKRICLIDVESRKAIETLETKFTSSIRFSQDGRYVIGQTKDRKRGLFDIVTGKYRLLPEATTYSPDYNWAIRVTSGFRAKSNLEFESVISGLKLEVPIDWSTNHAAHIAHHPTEGKLVLSSPFGDTLFVEYPQGETEDIWSTGTWSPDE